MNDLRLLTAVYRDVSLEACLLSLAMVLLEDENDCLLILQVCDACVQEGGFEEVMPVFLYGVSLLDEECEDAVWMLRVEVLLAWLQHFSERVESSLFHRKGCGVG